MTSQDLAELERELVPARTGRPSTFSPEIAEVILQRIAAGEGLKAICRDPGLPVASTVFDWLTKKPEFADRYAHAREQRADAIFEETLGIADDGSNDWMASNKPDDPGYVANGEHIQRSKLRVDTRKWFLAKLFPGRFADQAPTVAVQNNINVESAAASVDSKLIDLAERKD